MLHHLWKLSERKKKKKKERQKKKKKTQIKQKQNPFQNTNISTSYVQTLNAYVASYLPTSIKRRLPTIITPGSKFSNEDRDVILSATFGTLELKHERYDKEVKGEKERKDRKKIGESERKKENKPKEKKWLIFWIL